VRAFREQIASAVDLIVHEARLRDGSRKITRVTEVQGLHGETITLRDLFLFVPGGFEDGKVTGRLEPTGRRPKFMPRLEDAGVGLPPSVFGSEEPAGLAVGRRRAGRARRGRRGGRGRGPATLPRDGDARPKPRAP
jgi:hypothetical protein